jgi:hypothetical protein
VAADCGCQSTRWRISCADRAIDKTRLGGLPCIWMQAQRKMEVCSCLLPLPQDSFHFSAIHTKLGFAQSGNDHCLWRIHVVLQMFVQFVFCITSVCVQCIQLTWAEHIWSIVWFFCRPQFQCELIKVLWGCLSLQKFCKWRRVCAWHFLVEMMCEGIDYKQVGFGCVGLEQSMRSLGFNWVHWIP